MTDLEYIAICAILMLFVAVPAVASIDRCPDKRLKSAYLATGICTFLWLFFVVVYRVTKHEAFARYIFNLPFPFIAFLPPAIFITILLFYNRGRNINKRLIVLISIIPFFTSLTALFPPLSGLLRSTRVVSLSPLHIMEYTWNWWFYVHAGYSYLLLLASASVSIWEHRKLHGGYSRPSAMIVAGILCNVIGNLVSLTNSFDIDLTMITSSLGVFILYIAIVLNPNVEFLTTARKELFFSLDDIVFVLNNQRQVVDTNTAADRWLEMFGCAAMLPCDFAVVMECLTVSGGMVEQSMEHSAVMNVFLEVGGELVVYKITEHDISDKKGMRLGSFVKFADITQYSRIITQLEREADVDILTNMYNRRVYERQCLEMDVEGNLPLSVLMADVNGLKKVNDQLGHQYGDEMLRKVANIFVGICPENAIAARIGGDEFVIIAPVCTDEEIQSVMSRLKSKLSEERIMEFQPTIAIGTATKSNIDQDMKSLIMEADRSMYQQKEYDRRKN